MHSKQVLIFLSLFLLSVQADNQCNGDESTVACQSKTHLSQMIKHLQSELVQVRHENINCTSCWYEPCKNNGTCKPLTDTTFRCECTDEYDGPTCEQHIVCRKDSCGVNADCFVKNHQINCVCKPFYTGNPLKGCEMKTMRACGSGDPHYFTFDGLYYDYQGTCPYIFVEPCNGSLPEPWGRFAVKGKNILSQYNKHVSLVEEVEVELYDQTVHVDKEYHLYFNGVKQNIPFYYPNAFNPKISVKKIGSQVYIEDDRHLKVTFSYMGSICVELPDVEELRGNNTLCGLAGNRDFNCHDDLRTLNGFFYKPPKKECQLYSNSVVDDFGDSYIIRDDSFLDLSNDSACLTGSIVSNTTVTCDNVHGDFEIPQKECDPISEARFGRGPFAACQALGEDIIFAAYLGCVRDVCASSKYLCTSFSDFVKTCQSMLPNTPLDWRGQLHCSELHCPLHSNYSACASGCQPSCAAPNITDVCLQNCMEGCVCESGYVQSGSECVLLSECGCKDEMGNYHPAHDRWLTDDCTVVHTCENGKLRKEIKPCGQHAHCGMNAEHSRECLCDEGFEGDGYKCGDEDECLNPRVCNAKKNQGLCVNTIGSYECICHPYFRGSNCEIYAPRRHCADLHEYWGKTKSGTYTILPDFAHNGIAPFTKEFHVYCDMTTAENGETGGWMLMSSASNPSYMVNRTYDEYRNYFGNMDTKEPDAGILNVWLGLEMLHGMTTEMNTSLRVDIHHCATRRKPAISAYCTYPEFQVLGEESQFSVVIPEDCSGTDGSYEDGWVRWTTDIGPPFTAFDSEDSYCSQSFRNTGWWFSPDQRCGSANLNGEGYSCSNKPDLSELAHYLTWNGNPINSARLWLRPTNYPNMDIYKPTFPIPGVENPSTQGSTVALPSTSPGTPVDIQSTKQQMTSPPYTITILPTTAETQTRFPLKQSTTQQQMTSPPYTTTILPTTAETQTRFPWKQSTAHSSTPPPTKCCAGSEGTTVYPSIGGNQTPFARDQNNSHRRGFIIHTGPGPVRSAMGAGKPSVLAQEPKSEWDKRLEAFLQEYE